MDSSPLISVVTATFNAAEQLPHTLRSLRQQTRGDFEWLVVDGGSTDGTVELLRENEDLLSFWISEPDRGIYDAWNKACRHARGEWLIFLGAGDDFAAANTLEQCAVFLHSAAPLVNLIYGRQLLLRPTTRAVIETFGAPWKEIGQRWEIGRPALPPHGAAFQRKRLFSAEQPFDLRFPIAADAHFLLRHVRLAPPQFMPLDVTRGPIGGVSFRLETARRVGREIAAINRDLGIVPPPGHRLGDALRLQIASVVNLLPVPLAHRLADLLRRLTGKRPRWSGN